MATDYEFVTYMAIGFFVGLFLFWTGYSALKRKRLIENIPTSQVRSVAVGLVEIAGAVKKAAQVLTGPLSKQKLVWYKLVIEQEKGSGKSRRWVTVHQETKQVNFYCKDKTGKIEVDPKGAEGTLKRTFSQSSGFGRDPSPTVKEALRKLDVSFEGFLGINKKMKYSEEGIGLDQKVYILGSAETKTGMGAVKNEDNLLIKKGQNSPIFMISTGSEKTMLKRLGYQQSLVVIGPLVSVGCLAGFLFGLGLF